MADDIMAAPITHIVLAKKYFDESLKDKTEKDFFIGTLFPDIRYLSVIDRKKTHIDGLIVTDIKKEDSFLVGFKFHSILDIAREKFIVASDIYSLCPESKYRVQSLKLLEDEIFYRYVKDWNKYINYYNEILDDERDFRISEKDIRRWHSLLQRYFREQPNEHTIKDFALGIGFPEEGIREMNKNITIMRDNIKIVSILENLYKNFNSLL